MPRILSLSGKARHGKDFIAGLIVKMAKEEYGTTLGRYSFAWPLKSRVYGDVALLSGTTRLGGRWDGQPFATRYRYTDVYARGHDGAGRSGISRPSRLTLSTIGWSCHASQSEMSIPRSSHSE